MVRQRSHSAKFATERSVTESVIDNILHPELRDRMILLRGIEIY